jgi:ABC-type sugar transport system ATPase subunit
VSALLEVEGASKAFSGIPVLKDVSFSLAPGRVLGIVGENGAGKSTLMNVLGGVVFADRGRVRLAGEDYQPRGPAEAMTRGVAYIHQELNLLPNLSVAENLFLARLPRRGLLVDRRRLEALACERLHAVGLDVSPRALVGDLGPGARQLVEIARALAADARVVILDEPTTSLTAPEAERLFALVRRLRDEGRGLVYISHALGDVLRLADDVLVLRDGEVVGTGLASGFDEARLITLMVGRSVDTVFPARAGALAGEPALTVSRLGRGSAFRDVSFVVRRGEVVGLAGLMGAGRTELLRAIFGLQPPDSGEVRVHGRSLRPAPREAIAHGIAFVTEDRREDGLVLDATVADNLALPSLPAHARGGWIDRRALAGALAAQAEAVRLDAPAGLERPARTLSGGNQQKVVLGKWLLGRPSVVLLDEPTRGIDVGAKQHVYRLVADLAGAGTAVLLASSEIEELLGLADRVLVLRRGSVVDELPRPEFDRERILAAALGAAPAGGRP